MSEVDRCVGVEVSDEAGYQRYREAMMPLLLACGGRFLLDVRVAEVLKAPGDGKFNRLFILRFPDEKTAAEFFSGDAYTAIRDALFSPHVTSVTVVAKTTVAKTTVAKTTMAKTTMAKTVVAKTSGAQTGAAENGRKEMDPKRDPS